MVAERRASLPLRAVPGLGRFLAGAPPGLVVAVPPDRLGEACGEVGMGVPPAQLAPELRGLDRVAAVVAGAEGTRRDEYLPRALKPRTVALLGRNPKTASPGKPGPTVQLFIRSIGTKLVRAKRRHRSQDDGHLVPPPFSRNNILDPSVRFVFGWVSRVGKLDDNPFRVHDRKRYNQSGALVPIREYVVPRQHFTKRSDLKKEISFVSLAGADAKDYAEAGIDGTRNPPDSNIHRLLRSIGKRVEALAHPGNHLIG